jgi:hypothetical protein
MTYPDKFVRTSSDIPDCEHYAIMKDDGVHIPGDERSRTNPGHGYPAHTQDFIDYQVFLTKEKLLEKIKELETTLYGQKTPYKVIKVTPVSVNTSININIDIK